MSAPGRTDGVDTFPVEIRDDGVYVGFPAETPHVRTVSDVMAETLTAWGVRWVWGMVGQPNLGPADALRRRAEAGELTYFGIRHEGAASFAASAYGKLTGRPAACSSIAGPGATNLLTGLWDANVDRSPVLALTGQVNTQVLGTRPAAPYSPAVSKGRAVPTTGSASSATPQSAAPSSRIRSRRYSTS